MSVSNEPVSDLDAETVKQRLSKGAELWFAGSSGDRVTLVERENTTLISLEVLQELEQTGAVEAVCKLGSVVQYGLSQAGAAR